MYQPDVIDPDGSEILDQASLRDLVNKEVERLVADYSQLVMATAIEGTLMDAI